MKRALPLAAVACAAFTASCGDSWNPAASPTRDDAKATELVQRTFTAVEDRNLDALRSLLAPNFTLQRTEGTAIGRSAYLAHLPDLRSFRISNVRGVAYRDTLTASFTASTRLVAGGRTYSKAPSPYLASFQRDGDGNWHALSLANFTRPQQ